jgi:uncharacterized repeat protein (TIGR03803 family)
VRRYSSLLFFLALVLSVTSGLAQTLTTLYSSPDDAYPESPMMQASDGNFYIAEPNGGNFPACGAGCGSIFKMTPAGIVTKVYQFSGGSDGAQPLTGLVEGGDGSLYGVATAGGSTTDCQDSSPKGCGTVFKITPTGELSVLYTFSGVEGSYPTSLILGSNGNFYFVSGDYDDSADKGGIFELSYIPSLTRRTEGYLPGSFRVRMGISTAARVKGETSANARTMVAAHFIV